MRNLAHAVRVLATLLVTSLVVTSLAAAQDRDGAGEDAVLARVNELRAQAGCEPLSRDASLDAAAALHSAEMADADQLMHVSPRTGTPVDRVHAAGVGSSEIAENVAMHATSAAAQQALEASDGHLANMLNPRFTHVGIASVRDERGQYLTQVFARIEAAPAAELPAPEAPAPEAPAPEAAVVAPPVVAPPPAVAPPAIAAPPAVAAPALVSPPAAAGPTGAPGQVLTVRTQAGATLGFWVCGSGRWWYYPLPATTSQGQQLAADLSVTGSPPGYGGCAAGPTTGALAVSPGAPTGGVPPGGAPATAYGYGAPRYAPVPPPSYHQPRVVVPGSVIGPWGIGARVVGPQPYGRRVIILR